MCEAEAHLASLTHHMTLYPLVPRAQDDIIFIAIRMISSYTLASTHTQETSQYEV